MTQPRPQRNISSLTDRIEDLEVSLGVEGSKYAYYLADGMPKTRAFINAYGYRSSHMTDRHKERVWPLVLLLREENSQHISEQLNMDKQQRLEHLLETALIARHKYDHTSEAAHGAVYLKAMTIINTMTGDNAPTEIHHLVSVSNEQLEAMTHRQRTEAYKRMMQGNLELIEAPIIINATDNVASSDTNRSDEGGAT